MPRPPISTSSRDSSAVRASVYDAFLQLGGLEEDSQLADWIFNSPSADVDTPPLSVKTGVRFASPDSGSKFMESFDDPDSADEMAVHAISTQIPYRRPTRPAKRASIFIQRVRSKSKPRRRADSLTRRRSNVPVPSSADDSSVIRSRRSIFERRRAPPSQVADALLSPSLSTTSKKNPFTFFRSRSTTDVHEDNGQEVAIYNSERTSAETVTGTPTPTHSASQPSSSHGPATPGKNQPLGVTPPSPGSSVLDEEWERVSTSSPTAPKFPPARRNPFLSGNLEPASAEKAEDQTIFRKISFRTSKGHDRLSAPGTAKAAAAAPLRRTQSKPEAFARFHIPSLFPRAVSMPGESTAPSALARARSNV